MTVSIAPARTPLTAILVGLLLTGCAYRNEHHASGIGYRSIKDDPEPRAVDKHAVAPRGITAAPTKPRPKLQVTVTPRIEPQADKAPAHKIHTAPAPTAVDVQPKPSAPPATKSAAAIQAPAPTPAPAAPPATRSSEPVAVAPPPPVIQSAPASARQSEPERATVDLRRGGPAIASAPPAAVPAPAAPATSVEPPPAKPAAPPIVIQQKPSAAPADAPAQPKIAALTDDQRVRDTIARAREYMAGGRLINARSLLQDAARDNNPLLLTALAETFDPLHLRDQFPSLARSAEPTRALDFYRRASERGSTAAAQKLKSLAEFLAANPGFMKQ